MSAGLRVRPAGWLADLTPLLTGLGLMALLLAGAFLATGCTPGEPEAAGGSEPAAAAGEAPVRVASLVPFVTEALAMLPAEQVVVVAAVAPSGGVPPTGVIDLGSPHHPNHEVLAQARPDLVVGNDRLHAALSDSLGRGGAEVMLLGGATVEETFAGLERLGDRVGAGEAMRRRTEAARSELEALHLAEPIEMLPLFGAPDSFLAITPSTWLGDLLARLGYDNPVTVGSGRETHPGYVHLSDEVLVTLDPRRVLLVTHGDPGAVREAFQRQAAAGGPWARIADRATVLDPSLFGENPGLRLPEAARRLVEIVGARVAEPAVAEPAVAEPAR